MKRKRPLVLGLVAAVFLALAAVAVPAAAATSSGVVTGDVAPMQAVDGSFLYSYANRTTVWRYRGTVLWVSTTALSCDRNAPTNCTRIQAPSMWTDATAALDPKAPAATRVAGGIDALDYDDRGGAGEAKARVLDMYRRALRSALAK